MDIGEAKEKSLLEILKNDKKAEDIVKCGINPSLVLHVCEELASPPLIDKLDQHRVSWDLHVKYSVPQANVKTLMSLALWHVKKNPALITDAVRRHEEETERQLKEKESKMNAILDDDAECPEVAKCVEVSDDETLIPSKNENMHRSVISSNKSGHESESNDKNEHHNRSASDSSAVILQSDDDNVKEVSPRPSTSARKKRQRRTYASDSASDESISNEAVPMKKRSDAHDDRIHYEFDCESEESDVSELVSTKKKEKQHSSDVRNAKMKVAPGRKSNTASQPRYIQLDSRSDSSDISEPITPKKKGKRQISGGKGRKNARKAAPRKKSKKGKNPSSKDEEEEKVDGSEWDVVAVLGHRMVDGVKKYKVQWKTDERGEYWPEELNWVAESDMLCDELVEEYEESVLRKNEVREAPSREYLEERTLSVKELHEKRQRENMAKTKLLISEDKDICTSDEEEDRRDRTSGDIIDAIENCRRRYRRS